LAREADSESARIALGETPQRRRLAFDRPIPKGTYSLRLVFRGTLNDKLRGFYRSKYKDAAGQEPWLAATQFEATDARRAFPCWDEPAFKAVFASTLLIDAALTAVSNTGVLADYAEATRKFVGSGTSIPR